ncbi:MAG TPA: SDR family oxidoreductase [Acidimicrobiia bacterium]|nr:SDR family oxidoreductase [Acidimicrobiia bacterium]
MDLGLTGRVALVIATGDAGDACTRLLREEGATVVSSPEGAVDIVVAGGHDGPSAVLDVDSADALHDTWQVVVDSVDVYRRLVPGMAARRWGRLVWIGTAAAKSLDADDDELGAIVSLAMMALHKVVTGEESPENITANTVLRGGDADADDVAAAVAFLCSDGAGYMSGVTITVDGGEGSGMF